MRMIRGAAALVLTAAVVTSCDVGGFTDDGGSDPVTPVTDQSTVAMPTAIPSALLDCPDAGQEEPADGEQVDPQSLPLPDVDLTAARWDTPDGFAVTSRYYEDNPVEVLDSLWVAEPVSPPLPTLNVINIAIYVEVDWGDLVDACGDLPLELIEAQLAVYRDRIGATELSEPAMTEVAGVPAVEQAIAVSGYRYIGYWIFSPTQMLHLYCQWTDPQYQHTIEAGCNDLRASLQVG